jgi:hypothetical protein
VVETPAHRWQARQRLGRRRLGLEIDGSGGLVEGRQPGLLPEHQTVALAAVVGRAVAPGPIQKHRSGHPPNALSLDAGDAGPAVDGEFPAAKGGHFGHERDALEGTGAVQGGEDLGGAPDPDFLVASERRAGDPAEDRPMGGELQRHASRPPPEIGRSPAKPPRRGDVGGEAAGSPRPSMGHGIEVHPDRIGIELLYFFRAEAG